LQIDVDGALLYQRTDRRGRKLARLLGLAAEVSRRGERLRVRLSEARKA